MKKNSAPQATADKVVAIQNNPRAAWVEDARQIAEQGDDALVWPELANVADAELDWE